MGKRKRARPTTQSEDDVVIPEGEQWRIIDESGILQGIKRPTELGTNDHDSDAERASESESYVRIPDDEDGQAGDLSDSVFQAALLLVPMCFLYATMDLSVEILAAQRHALTTMLRKACVECSMHNILPSGRKPGESLLSYQVCNFRELVHVHRLNLPSSVVSSCVL